MVLAASVNKDIIGTPAILVAKCVIMKILGIIVWNQTSIIALRQCFLPPTVCMDVFIQVPKPTLMNTRARNVPSVVTITERAG